MVDAENEHSVSVQSVQSLSILSSSISVSLIKPKIETRDRDRDLETKVTKIDEEETKKQPPPVAVDHVPIPNQILDIQEMNPNMNRPLNIQFEGLLLKRSRYIRTWRSRWIVIIANTIHTYKCDSKYKDATEIINISDIKSIQINTNTKQKHSFDIHLETISFTFAAESKLIQTKWITELSKLIALNEACVTEIDDKTKTLISHGCSHFRRNCSLLASCCDNWYFCSYCHDEHEYGFIQNGHQLDRNSIAQIRCMQCGKEQPPSNRCINCKLQMANYYCSICKFWDNNPQHLLFHCDGCGVCRSGDKSEYIHCNKCGVCLDKHYFKNHQCMEKATQCDCPICGDYLHMSDKPVTFWTGCGHAIHVSCMQDFLVYDTLCPICRAPWLPT